MPADAARLPDAFYIPPGDRKSQARGRKRGGKAGGGGGARGAAAQLSAEEHAAVVRVRQKRILQQLALMPPDDSPYVGGRTRPNPELQLQVEQWRAEGVLPPAAGPEAKVAIG